LQVDGNANKHHAQLGFRPPALSATIVARELQNLNKIMNISTTTPPFLSVVFVMDYQKP
jgi:hypothetical protein